MKAGRCRALLCWAHAGGPGISQAQSGCVFSLATACQSMHDSPSQLHGGVSSEVISMLTSASTLSSLSDWNPSISAFPPAPGPLTIPPSKSALGIPVSWLDSPLSPYLNGNPPLAPLHWLHGVLLLPKSIAKMPFLL